MKSGWKIVSLCLIVSVCTFIQEYLPDINNTTLSNSFCVYEEYFYQQKFDFKKRCYIENQTHHRLHLVAHDLTNEEHNLTLFCEKGESILSSDPESEKIFATETSNCITFLFSGMDFDGTVFFENSRLYPGPEVTILPSDINITAVNEDNFIEFDLILNVSEYLEVLKLEIGYYNMEEIIDYEISTDLDLISDYIHNGRINVSFSNASIGVNLIHVKIQVGAVQGKFPIVLDCFHTRNITFELKLALDGEFIEFDEQVRCHKRIAELEYLKAKEPWIYGYSNPQIFNVTFLCDGNLTFRLDPLSRENIEFLTVDGELKDFNMSRCVYEGHDCILVNAKLDAPSNVSMGIKIYDKTWFLRPSLVENESIPQVITDKYVKTSKFIDADNELVKQWSHQIVKNETNPIVIASLLYWNLTQTLEWDEAYIEFNEVNETASATLRNRAGVCRHLSRAFAALAISNGIPTKNITGTAFNLHWNLTELKKNHSWNEIFLPKYGWVPVEITWGYFGLLPNTHAIISYWEYVGDHLNITQVGNTLSTQTIEASKCFLKQLLEMYKSEVEKLPTEKRESALILFEQAKLFAEYGNVQDTILTLEKISSISLHTQETDGGWFIILLIGSLIVGIFLLVLKSKRGRA